MSKSNEQELIEVIRKARASPEKAGELRRQTLEHLIDATHSSASSLKIIAAGNICHFFTHFPDLEEAAINAVYDLCEDQDSKVRIAGYKAIKDVSQEQPRWVKRNADVLVQLLQSDEPGEVIVVKKALIAHLDIDPRVTLSVLCDQVLPAEGPLDEEERFVRERLRSLVVAFLAGQAQRAVIRHTRNPGEVEDVLINGLLMAMPKLTVTDSQLAVKQLLVLLPSFKTPSERASQFPGLVLNKARENFAIAVRKRGPINFSTTKDCLELVNLLVIQQKVASAIQLLQFYSTSLTKKATLQRLSEDDRIWVIASMAETLAVVDDEVLSQDDGAAAERASVQKQMIDAFPILLEQLENSKMVDSRSWEASETFLRSSLRHRADTNWTAPKHLIATLDRIHTLESTETTQVKVQAVQGLIRSLTQPKKSMATLGSPQATNAAGTHDVDGRTRNSNKRKAAPLPDRPLSSGSPPRRTINLQRTWNRPNQAMADSSKSFRGSTSTSITMQVAQSVSDDALRPLKRPKLDGGGNYNSRPSLLSRMSKTVTNLEPTAPSPAKVNLSISDGDLSAPGGYSIRGAAKSHRDTGSPPRKTSLLDRISSDDLPNNRNRRGRTHR